MSAATSVTGLRARLSTGRVVAAVLLVALVVAMALSTTVVTPDSALGRESAPFSAAAYGKKAFPEQRAFIADHAVAAKTLAAALAEDQQAAAEKYGVASANGASTEVPVTFTGVVGKVPATGYTPVKVPGLPGGTTVQVQLGPAVVGTDLRDADGTVQLGDFENQIQYQNAATAINDESKKMLARAGAPDLAGKTIRVTGVFSLVNPRTWNVTASELEVVS